MPVSQKMPTLIPYYTVENPERAITFYEEAFGFHLLSEPSRGEDGSLLHVEMGYQDVVFMFCPEGTPEGTAGVKAKAPLSSTAPFPLTLYVYCPNVDDLYQKAMAHGACSLEPPQDAFWGDRFCQLKDTEGYLWSFATPLPGSQEK